MSVTAHAESVAGSKGLKAGALGLVATTVIAVASTAPGYSLAASLGFITDETGVKAASIIWIAFVPMACIAAAFYYLNKADADCGTTFAWGTRAFGPRTGWIGSWGLIMADLVIMPNLAGISGSYLLLLFGLEDQASNFVWVTALGCLFIIAMTWICWKGIELSARTQVALLGTELAVLGVFAAVTIAKSFGDGATLTQAVDQGDGTTLDTTYQSVSPSLDWLWPSGLSASALTAGLVLAVFIYWGWDTAVSVNEECEDSNRTPGVAAVISTFILLAIYLLVTFGAVAYLGPQFLSDNADDALYAVGQESVGGFFNKLVIISILTSAAASCQTTILPATRSMLSMGSHGAAPSRLASIDRRTLTPAFSTWFFGVLSCLWFVVLVVIQENTGTLAYDAAIAGVGIMIAFYYGLSGLACIWYYRRWLLSSTKSFFMVGVLPAIGSSILGYIMVKTLIDSSKEDYEYGLLFGMGTVFVIGVGLMLLGVPLMEWSRVKNPAFFTFQADPASSAPNPIVDTEPAEPLGSYRKGV